MRKYAKELFCLFFLFLTSLSVYAQQKTQKDHTKKRHELSLGYGLWSTISLMEGVHGGEYGYNETSAQKRTGIISVSYKYFITSRFYAGIGTAYEYESGNWYDEYGWTKVVLRGIYKRNVFSVGPEIGIIYSSHDGPGKVYGYIAAGRSYLNEVDAYSPEFYRTHFENGVNQLGNSRESANNRSRWAMQICPLGIRFGRKIGGFAELGFGYKGIINMGAKIKL